MLLNETNTGLTLKQHLQNTINQTIIVLETTNNLHIIWDSLFSVIRDAFYTKINLAYIRSLMPVLWQLNDYLYDRVQRIKSKYNLRQYLGVHIRTGDKNSEDHPLDMTIYFETLLTFAKESNITSVYVACDDFTSVQKLNQINNERHHPFQIYSTTPIQYSGNDRLTFIRKNSTE